MLYVPVQTLNITPKFRHIKTKTNNYTSIKKLSSIDGIFFLLQINFTKTIG